MHLVVFFVTILECILFLSVKSSSVHRNLSTDKEALISFRSKLNSPEPPNFLSSWNNQNSSPCNWTGVTCNGFGQRVVSLNLSGFGIEGTISPHIANLSFLRSIDLGNNKLRGAIPPEIGNLFRLRFLNLSLNSLEGRIPLNISKLTQLQSLDLMANKITGEIPQELGHLSKLEVLKLGQNDIWGNIPPSLSNLSSLTVLNMGTNGLSGIIPGELGNLRNLKVLDLTINGLTGTVPSAIYNMSSLVKLAVASNILWGEIPYDVGIKLPNLLIFNYCFNNFTGRIPGSLHNLTNIQVIRMAHNLLVGTVPPGLGNLPFLQMYNIGFNKIHNPRDDGLSFITSLANSTGLNFLAIDGNAFEGVLPESIGNLSKVLSKLYIGKNRIHGGIPESIGLLRSLSLLELNDNSISGKIPEAISHLQELQYLGLARNKISGTIPNSLGNLRKLNKIDLSRNEMVGGIPTSFKNFQSLLSLDLSNNKLSGSIPKEVLNLPSLSIILNLSKNFLDGPLPQVGLLEKVVTIDLSGNHLFGDIPQSFERCKSLEQLILANNNFSGHVPIAFAELKGLEVLDLSSNQLSGSIPPDIQKLEALRSLNLSFNDLEGNIPSRGVFGNMSNVHLEGNQNLCLHSKCENTPNNIRQIEFKVILPIIATAVVCFLIALFMVSRGRQAKVNIKCPDDSKNGKPEMISYHELREATRDFDQENLIDWICGKRKHPDGKGLSFLERLNISIDVASALNYLHHDCEVPIVHCDLKPDNILLDEEMTAKVGDFGLARLLQERMSNQVSISSTYIVKGSIGYIPPEYGLCEKSSTAGDVYSYGVMLLELFTGMSPLQESFSGDLNLVKWVESYFLEKEVQVFNLDDEVKNEEQSMNPEAENECLITVIRIGLSCAKDSPDGRINIREALRSLINARDVFLKSDAYSEDRNHEK
ncbi:putative Serine-threonine protein kinase, plant-type [Heracleum sosnowskyi]|uniref:non-specific serine/threonine protein kinase n=1 Tax=Heracleum sosnowskyi TaxID=360622 RepID=A0AAD8GNM5_9APIA|nr:putative Serine-threonine protein kinase, plant-type [Heracleum sosnowskyi]